MATQHDTTLTPDNASLAASELKAMLDMLNGASVSDLTLFDQTLETYAATMIEKIDTVCRWFHQDHAASNITGFRVRLITFGANKAEVIKVVRDHLIDHYEADHKIGLADATELVETAPCAIEVFDKESDAVGLADALKAAGATVDIQYPNAAADMAHKVNSVPENRRSGGTAFDDLTLALERAETLVQAINDAVMHGEDRNVVGLAAMVRHHIEDAESICDANRHWS